MRLVAERFLNSIVIWYYNNGYMVLFRDNNDSEDNHQRVLLRAEVLVPSLGRVRGDHYDKADLSCVRS